MVSVAVAAKVKHFILVSADRAVNSTNFMSASTRLAELVCQALAKNKASRCLGLCGLGMFWGRLCQ